MGYFIMKMRLRINMYKSLLLLRLRVNVKHVCDDRLLCIA